MRIAGVEIPQRLIDAHQSGQLVIFVGAGASFDSGLPSYQGLAEKIGDDAFLPMPAGIAPDAFLSYLVKEHDIPVHDRTAAIVGNPESRPNELHRALAALVSKCPVPRVVTTNYDRHLTTALGSLGVQLDEYASPALPLGDDFKGLVHLHGRSDADPADCVVTSRDFGRAYLTDAWAARFLRAMFSTYDVLFVGYSLNDVVVGYLTQAIGAGPGRRFALLSSADERENATRLGIEPIGYEVTGNDHSCLHQCISEWSNLAGMSLVDHARRIERLLEDESPTAAELAYLQDVISDETRVAQFIRTARGPYWLEWAAKQAVFRESLASRQVERGDVVASALMTWFGNHYVTDQALSQAAWAVFEDCGGQMSPAAWDAIGWTVGRLQPDERGSSMHRWILALITDAPRDGHDWIEHLGRKLRLPADELVLAPVFEHLTTPKSVVPLRGSWRSSQLPAEMHVIEHVTGLLQATHEDHPLELFFLGIRVLERLAAIRQAAGIDFDDVSFGRSAIEPHEQDDMRGPVDVVIDLVRDAAAAAAAQQSARGIVLKRCLASRSAVVHRVALHAMAETPSPDDDIRHVLTHNLLNSTDLHHEVFRLLRRTVAHASNRVIDELLTAVDDVGHSGVRAETAEYHRLMTLVWIRDSGVSSERLDRRIMGIQQLHPEWRQRDHPDLLRSSSSGFVQHFPPCTPEEVESLIAGDAAEIPHWLSSFGQTWGQPTDEDASQLLMEVIRTEPSLGLTVWDAADGDPRTWAVVIAGWSGAEVDETVAEEIIARVRRVEGTALTDDVARMLTTRGSHAFDWSRFEPAVEAVETLISGASGVMAASGFDDALSHAHNAGTGALGEMLIRALLLSEPASSLRKSAGRLLHAALRPDGPESDPIRHVAMTHLADLLAIDSELVDQYLLPLLMDRKSDERLEYWATYLRHPVWSDALRERGLVEEAAHVWNTVERGDIADRLAGLLVSMALDGTTTNDGVLLRASGTDDAGKRVALLNALAHWIRARDAGTVEAAWPSIRNFVESRAAGVPRRLLPSEVACLDEAVVELGPRFTDGVQLVAPLDSSREERRIVFFKLKQLAEEDDAPPGSIATFLLHLLAGAAPPFWDSHYVTEIMGAVGHEIDDQLTSRLQEEALRLGISSALAW